VTLPVLKPKYLECLQLVKAYGSKRTGQRKGSMRDIRAQKARGRLGEAGVHHIFWRRLQGIFGKYGLLCTLGVAMGENPSVVCHNNSANTFPRAVLKDKDGAGGV
jgi:hypothetical protein